MSATAYSQREMSGRLEMMVRFRDRGMRWPLREGDVIEVWRGTTFCGAIPAGLVTMLITHHLSASQLVAHFSKALRPEPKKMPSRRSRATRILVMASTIILGVC
jgi:hypothetical protein